MPVEMRSVGTVTSSPFLQETKTKANNIYFFIVLKINIHTKSVILCLWIVVASAGWEFRINPPFIRFGKSEQVRCAYIQSYFMDLKSVEYRFRNGITQL